MLQLHCSTQNEHCQVKEKENNTKQGDFMEDNKKLEEIARENEREYQKKWRAANRDKVKEYNKRYWQKRAIKLQQGAEGDTGNE